MTLVVWIVLGLVSGFVANQMLNKNGEGPVLNVVVGAVGALIGGYLCNLLAPTLASGLGFWNVFSAVVGAMALLDIKQAFLGGRPVRT